jgi:hypothetical protein
MNCLFVQMDGFAFQPFKSTCIFRDKDITMYLLKNGLISKFLLNRDVY